MVNALETVLLDPLEIEPDVGEVLRYLGYPTGVAPPPRVSEHIGRAIETSRESLRPRATYSLYEVEAVDERSVTLAGGVTFRGAIGEYLDAARCAAVFLATAGAEIVHLAREAVRSGDTLGGYILGAIGSQIAEGAVDALVDDLREKTRAGEALTLRYSPGFCGMDITQQQLIFDLVEFDAVEVELLPSFMMKPLKSVSGIIGVGPVEAVIAYGAPCDRCPLLDCSMRR